MLLHYLEKLWHWNDVTADITAVFVNMFYSNEDKILTKNLYPLKGYKATELVDEFTNKWWTKSSIKGQVSSKMTFVFYLPVRISIFLGTFL